MPNHKCKDIDIRKILGGTGGDGGRFQWDNGRYPGRHGVITGAVLPSTGSQEGTEHSIKGTQWQERGSDAKTGASFQKD